MRLQCLGIAVLSVAALPAAAQTHVISNGEVTLTFQEDAARGIVLTSIGDSLEPTAFSLDRVDLWSVELRDAAGNVQPVTPSTSTFGFSLLTTATAFTAIWSGVSHPLVAGTFDFAMHGEILGNDRVVQFLEGIDASATARAAYGVDAPRVQFLERGEASDQRLSYPVVTGVLIPDPMHNPVVPTVGGTQGVLALSPFRVHPGFLSMQFFSYYDSSVQDGPALFLGTRDPLGYAKQLVTEREDHATGPDALLHHLHQIPQDNLTTQVYYSPYPFVLGTTRGDWYDAAMFYRNWGLQQPWAAKGRMLDNPDFSPLMAEADMFGPYTEGSCTNPPLGVGPNRDPSTFDYLKSLVVEQETTFGVDSIVGHIYGWDQNSFDANWGEWFPVIPEYVTNAADLASAGGVFAPYTNIGTYSTSAPGYTSSYVGSNGLFGGQFTGTPVEDNAVWREDGSVGQIQVGAAFKNGACGTGVTPSNITLTCLDLASDFCEAYATYLAEIGATYGARGTYLDVFTNEESRPSYNPNLGHPVGGGAYDVQGKRDLVQDLKDYMRTASTVADPDFYVVSENSNEYYVDELEMTYQTGSPLSLYSSTGGVAFYVAPLFQAVYHDYQLTSPFLQVLTDAGTPLLSNPELGYWGRCLYASRLFLGFEPFAGAYLSSATMQSVQTAHPLFDGVVRMIRDYMAILQQDRTRDFVRFGRRMRDPHATSVNTVDVPLQDPSLPPVTSSSPLLFGFVPYGETQPLVYAGAFGRPDLESVGLLLMNWTKASDNNACSCFGGMAGNQSITLSIAPQDYELSPGTYVLKEVTPPGTPPPPTPIPFSWTGPKSFSFSMPSASLRFVYLERQ